MICVERSPPTWHSSARRPMLWRGFLITGPALSPASQLYTTATSSWMRCGRRLKNTTSTLAKSCNPHLVDLGTSASIERSWLHGVAHRLDQPDFAPCAIVPGVGQGVADAQRRPGSKKEQGTSLAIRKAEPA